MIFEQIEKIYRKSVYTRTDENGCIFYFSSDDFEGLHKEAYPFRSSGGHKLQGYFYYYDNYLKDRIVMFEHGMGSGHRGYMKEIEQLARHGYLVFAYDHTGCMESGGGNTGGFIQSLRDLNDAVGVLKADDRYKDMELSVMGHSWGGFSTLNIAAFHRDVRHIVALSGFVSVEGILRQSFSGILSCFYKRIYEKERLANPDWIDCSAVDALRNTSAEVLVMHSLDDRVVKCAHSFDLLEKELSGRKNITFMKVNGKGHNPNYTAAAVKYKDEFFKTYQKMMKKNLLKTEEEKKSFKERYDWHRMTEQDETVWKRIFETLDS